MNLLNFALGGLTGGLMNSPFTALTGVGGALLLSSSHSAAGGSAAAAVPSRDGAVSDLPGILSSVNLLQQAAAGLQSDGATSSTASTSASSEPDLTVPPLPPMPTPKAPPAVPTDDHGQSNIVFSDPSADGAFIQ